MPSGEAAIAAVCSSRYICSGYSAGDGDAVAAAGARRRRQATLHESLRLLQQGVRTVHV